MIKELNLPQEFTLLALNEQGNINNNVSGYQKMYFLAAIFVELALLGKIEIQEKLLVVKDQKQTQIFHLDAVVEKFNYKPLFNIIVVLSLYLIGGGLLLISSDVLV